MAVAVDETTAWDSPGVSPDLWRRIEDAERLLEKGARGRWDQYDGLVVAPSGCDEPVWDLVASCNASAPMLGQFTLAGQDVHARLIVALHNLAPELFAALKGLYERLLTLEQQERQRAAALEGLREENERLQGQRDALRETAMLIVHGPHGGPKLRSNLAALLRVAQACDAALAEGSER